MISEKDWEGSKKDKEIDLKGRKGLLKKKRKFDKKEMAEQMMAKKKRKGGLKLNPVSKGHAPKGAHGRAAVHALGRTKTTGNFKKIEAAKGKGAAINAYQNALKAHQAKKRKEAPKTGKELLNKAMKRFCK